MRVEIEQVTEAGLWRPVRTCRSTEEAVQTLRWLVVEGNHDPESFRVQEFPND